MSLAALSLSQTKSTSPGRPDRLYYFAASFLARDSTFVRPVLRPSCFLADCSAFLAFGLLEPVSLATLVPV